MYSTVLSFTLCVFHQTYTLEKLSRSVPQEQNIYIFFKDAISGPMTPSLIVMLCKFNVHCESDNFILSKSNSKAVEHSLFFFNRDYMGNNAGNKSGVPFFLHTETHHIME